MGCGSGPADLLLWGIKTCSAIIPGYQIPMAAASICSPATSLFGLSLPQPLPHYPPPRSTGVPPSSHADLKSQLPSVLPERVPSLICPPPFLEGGGREPHEALCDLLALRNAPPRPPHVGTGPLWDHFLPQFLEVNRVPAPLLWACPGGLFLASAPGV